MKVDNALNEIVIPKGFNVHGHFRGGIRVSTS